MVNPTCVLCQAECENEWGNNPAPILHRDLGVCCDVCNMTKVIPARLYGLSRIKMRVEEDE